MRQPKLGGTMPSPGEKDGDNNAFYRDITETSISAVPGTQGLKNLGSTCYLNSALQLLSHVVPLTSSMLKKRDEKEKKPVTSQYAKLLRAMWCSSDKELLRDCVDNLARKVREMKNAFKVDNQHDCEEFLSALLDLLHNELKPARDENPEVEPPPGRQGDPLKKYLQQAENSVVSDQFRIVTCETVTCDACNSQTRHYDMTNTLQLTYQSTVPKDVFWVPLDVSVGVIPRRLSLRVPDPYSVKQMREALLQKVRKPENTNITFYRVCNHITHEIRDVKDSNVTDIPNRLDIYAYEYPDDGAIMMVYVSNLCEGRYFGHSAYFPFKLTDFDDEESVTKQLLKYMERYVRVPENAAALQEEKPSPKAVVPEQMDAAQEEIEDTEQMDVAQEETEDTQDDEDFYPPDTLDYISDNSDDPNNGEALDTVEEEESEEHGNDSPGHVEGLRSKNDDREATAPSEAPDVMVDMEREKDENEDMAKENTDDNEKTAMDTGDVVHELREHGADVGEKVKTEGVHIDKEEDKTLDSAKTTAELQPRSDTGGDKENDPHSQHQGMQAGDDIVMDTTDTTAVTEGNPPTQSAETRRQKRKKSANSPFSVRGYTYRKENQNYTKIPVDLNEAECLELEWSKDSRKLYDEDMAEAFDQDDPVTTDFDSSAPLTLQSLLESFVAEEFLVGDNAWACPSCQKKKSATRKTAIKVLPPYLIVHFKSRQGRDSKNDQLVDFPIRDLDMSRYLDSPEKNKPLIYDLVAVCNHSGGMGSGHYWAYAKNKLDGRWRVFNDSEVYLIERGLEKEMVTNLAYVLLYERRTDNAEMAKVLEEAINTTPQGSEEQRSPAADLPPLVPPGDPPLSSSVPPSSPPKKAPRGPAA